MIAGIWHKLRFFDYISRAGLLGVCNNNTVYRLWPMVDEMTLKNTARHEAFHLSLLVIDESGKWPDIEALRDEATALALASPALAPILNDYREKGFSLRDEPLVLLADTTADGVDLAAQGASPRLAALVQAITRPKPLMPALKAAVNAIAAGGMVWSIFAGVTAL